MPRDIPKFFDQVSGASYREILDLSDWDHSVAVNGPARAGSRGARTIPI